MSEQFDFISIKKKANVHFNGASISHAIVLKDEPYRVCRRVNILRDYPDDKTKLYPRN